MLSCSLFLGSPELPTPKDPPSVLRGKPLPPDYHREPSTTGGGGGGFLRVITVRDGKTLY